MSLLIRKKVYRTWIKSGILHALNALNEKLNLSDDVHWAFSQIDKGHFGTDFPSLGSLSEKIVFLIFLKLFCPRT